MSSGKLISFEGIDGVGKSTQIKLLHEYLLEQGKDVTLLREPGSTTFGESVRDILLKIKDSSEDLIADTKFLLFSAARAEMVWQHLRPMLNQNIIVLLDRYCDSSIAYQGYGSGIDIAYICRINDRVTGSRYPDMTILLDADPSTALNRLTIKDDFEQEGLEYFNRVRNGYLALAKDDAKRFRVIDATSDVKTISQKIIDYVSGIL